MLPLLQWKRSITYFECVSVALGIQHAKRMPRIILSYSACLALQNDSTLSHKRQELKNVTEHKMYVCMFWFSLQLLFETFPIL